MVWLLWSKVESVDRCVNVLLQVRHVRVGVRWYLQGRKGEGSSQDGCERLKVYRAEQDLSGVVKRMGR